MAFDGALDSYLEHHMVQSPQACKATMESTFNFAQELWVEVQSGDTGALQTTLSVLGTPLLKDYLECHAAEDTEAQELSYPH